MGSETSDGSDTIMADETKGPAYRACADSGISLISLADNISYEAETLDNHYEQEGILDFDPGSDSHTLLIPQLPRSVRKARDKLIDSAFKMLELAAGPSGMISIAMSQVQFLGALKWLLHFNIFDRISENAEMEYDYLADKADVPAPVLKRMLRMAMANHVFCEVDGNKVCHNQFSWKLAKDADFLRGVPFFCDNVIPAMGKMVEKTIRLQEEGDGDDWCLNYQGFLNDEKEADGHSRLMSLLGSLPSTYSAEVVHGTVSWSSLPKGALIVDLNSRSPCVWELATLFPHLRFHVHVDTDKIDVMKDYVKKRGPDLLTRIEFRPRELNAIALKANVYLFPTLTHRCMETDLVWFLDYIFDREMSPHSRVIFIEPLLPDSGCSILAKERISQCRNISDWQLQNASDRTLKELAAVVKRSCRSLQIDSHTRRPNSSMTTVVFRLSDDYLCPRFE